MLLFYGKNLKPFNVMYQYLQNQEKAIRSHCKGNCSITYLLFTPWPTLIKNSSWEKQKSKWQHFFFQTSPPLQYLLQYLSSCYGSTERGGWSFSKNNRKEKGNVSWGFITCTRLKMDERRWKKVFSISFCMSSSCTIRGAGSLCIFLEGSGPTMQKYCAKTKMDGTLVDFANIHQGWFQFWSKIS